MEACLKMRVAVLSIFASAALNAASITPTTAAAADRAGFEAGIARVKAEMLSDPAQSIALAKSMERNKEWMASPESRATIKWLLGEAYIRVDQPKKSIAFLQEARDSAKIRSSESQLYADIMLSEAGALTYIGKIAKALDNLQRAHKIFVTLSNDRSQAKSLIMIALVYYGANDFSSALRYFDQAIDVYDADPGLSVAIYNGRGNAFKELKRFDEAAADYARALELARGLKSQLLIAQVLSNIAHNGLMAERLDVAARAIAEGLLLTNRAEAASYRPVFLALAARAAMMRRDLVAGERLIDERFRGVDLTKTILLDREAHDTAFRIYSQRGRSVDALAHLSALKRLDDQATELARSNTAALASARFDFANQELRIARLKAVDLQKSVAYERDRSRSQLTIFAGAAIATLLIIMILGIGLITLRRSRNKLAMSNAALGKALAAKTEFLATTSHEIRTPLNGILGMTEVMLADATMKPVTRERLALVHGAGTTMRALVDDILDVAKMESGRMTVENEVIDIRATITNAASLWVEQAGGKGLGFLREDDDGADWLVGDAARIRQIIFNLLSNAVKFTAAGHIKLSTITAGDRWRLVVEDTGIGIDPAQHEAIFEAFRQADSGTTRQFGGTGLGLSICRSLSRAMGGDVTVASRLGEGATFTLDLPLVRAQPPASASATAGCGILVVDRNPITRAMLKAVLEPRGAPMSFADSLATALPIVSQSGPATIVIDAATLAAPDDLRELAKRAAAVTANVTIALLGPAPGASEEAALRAAGVTMVIAKPIARDALIARLFGDESNVSVLVPQAA